MELEKHLSVTDRAKLDWLCLSGESPESCLKRLITNEYHTIKGGATRWTTAHEAANYLGLSPITLDRKARAGEIACFRPGKERRYLRSDLDDWVAAHREPSRKELADEAAMILARRK